MDWFLEAGKGLSGWLALLSAICAVAGAFLAARFATRREVKDAMTKAAADDTAVKVALSEEDARLAERVGELEKSVDRLKTGLKNTPTRAELHETQLEMRKLEGSINVLSERMQGVTTMMGKIEQPLSLLVEHQLNLDRSR